jgi:hypothetical protein
MQSRRSASRYRRSQTERLFFPKAAVQTSKKSAVFTGRKRPRLCENSVAIIIILSGTSIRDEWLYRRRRPKTARFGWLISA